MTLAEKIVYSHLDDPKNQVIRAKGLHSWSDKTRTSRHALSIKRLLKPWPNGLISQRKFAKPELVCGLAMGGKQIRKWACKSQKAINFTHIIG